MSATVPRIHLTVERDMRDDVARRTFRGDHPPLPRAPRRRDLGRGWRRCNGRCDHRRRCDHRGWDRRRRGDRARRRWWSPCRLRMGLPRAKYSWSSLASSAGKHFATAGRVANALVQRFAAQAFDYPVLLNVNVPDCPYEALRGIQVTRLGRRHKAEPAVKSVTPRGELVYWIGAAGPAA